MIIDQNKNQLVKILDPLRFNYDLQSYFHSIIQLLFTNVTFSFVLTRYDYTHVCAG